MRSLSPSALAGTSYERQRFEEKHRENTRHQIQDDSTREGKHDCEKKPSFVAST
jgi:hypothetical protein